MKNRNGKSQKNFTNTSQNNKGPKVIDDNNSMVSFKQDFRDLDRRKSYVLSFPGLIMPDRFITFLAYGQPSLLFMNGVSTGNYVFSGNGCFDPDITSTGHQPKGFDQFATFYEDYRVYSSEIRLVVLYASDVVTITITPATNGTSPGSVQAALEAPYNTELTLSSTLVNPTIERTISTYKIFGVRRQMVHDSSDFGPPTTSNPISQWYWNINGQSKDGILTASVTINVMVVYHIEFFNRRPLSQS